MNGRKSEHSCACWWYKIKNATHSSLITVLTKLRAGTSIFAVRPRVTRQNDFASSAFRNYYWYNIQIRSPNERRLRIVLVHRTWSKVSRLPASANRHSYTARRDRLVLLTRTNWLGYLSSRERATGQIALSHGLLYAFDLVLVFFFYLSSRPPWLPWATSPDSSLSP